MSGVWDSTFLGHPPGARGGFKGQLSYLKSQFQRFLYQTLCLFSKIKEMGFSLCRLGHTPGGGTWGCLGSIFFPNMVVWHIKLKGMVSRTGYKLNVHPMVKLVTLIRERGVLAMAPHRLREYKVSHFLRCFKIWRLLFDCSFSFLFTPIDRLWHEAC